MRRSATSGAAVWAPPRAGRPTSISPTTASSSRPWLIARGQGQPIITADSARKTLEIALAMYQSAKTEKPVSLPLADEKVIWE